MSSRAACSFTGSAKLLRRQLLLEPRQVGDDLAAQTDQEAGEHE